MLRKTFTVATALPPNDALGRLVQLLETEGVKVAREENRVRSLRTPLPLLNVDPRLYSRRNWVGINPFALLTAIEAKANASSGGTIVDVSIDRRRIILLLVLEALVAIATAFNAPWLPAGARDVRPSSGVMTFRISTAFFLQKLRQFRCRSTATVLRNGRHGPRPGCRAAARRSPPR